MPVSFPQGNPFDKLSKLERAFVQGVRDGVLETAVAIKTKAQLNIVDLNKVDQAILYGSIAANVTQVGTVVRGEVVVGAGYGRWVEFGRAGTQSDPTHGDPNAAKAAWPPVDVIRAWVARHNATFAVSGRTKSGRARRAKEADLKSVAFLVGRAIFLRGIKPTPFLIPAFLLIAPHLPRAIRDAVAARRASVT